MSLLRGACLRIVRGVRKLHGVSTKNRCRGLQVASVQEVGSTAPWLCYPPHFPPPSPAPFPNLS